ncbi:outer membrane beta-barrel protein [Flammeovirga kamogawensis]|uniref:Porin family protein n=1 Tax=Flammeovirga kamogawensis TaxID=373891 RepID=A0ABX8GRF5_9BACT|nr:outer membrane beta-barrel protein [Flammeovirga kamogawensis]MBB6463833.1 hypothetical protein [Flammeovirga kamogawensis]QWG06150.1 porin family protein [Flammeovirga kamogawensis]TRX67981.1 outer membrane beta-barrel protein [Flammeovirga kamogawensis]
MQKKEDNYGDFEKVWKDAFQNESVAPPADLWDSIEEEIDGFNKKKSYHTFLRSVAAMITVGLLTSFLVKYDMPREESFAGIKVITNDKKIETASVLPVNILEGVPSKKISIVENISKIDFTDKMNDIPSRKIVTETKKVIDNDEETSEYVYHELGRIEREKTDIQNDLALNSSYNQNLISAGTVSGNKRKKQNYIGVNIEMQSIDPNLKVNDQLISNTAIAPVIGIEGGVKFNKGQFLALGVKFTDLLYTVNHNDNSGEIAQKVLSIPVKVGYAFEKEKWSLGVHAAAVTNVLLQHKTTNDTLINGSDLSTVSLTAQVGAELNYKLSEKYSVKLGTSYGMSLTDQSTNEDISLTPKAYAVSMGLKYNII